MSMEVPKDQLEVINLLQNIEAGQRETLKRVEKLEDRLEKHSSVSASNHAAVMAAFPANDPEGHRRFHETQILMLEEKRQLKKAIQEKTISGLIWSGLVASGTAIYQQFFHK